MSMNDGGDPWGSGPAKPGNVTPGPGNPWMKKVSGKGGGGGRGGGNGAGGPPPDFDAWLAQLRDWFGGMRPRGQLQATLLALAVLVGVWLMTGFYQVGSDQIGVVMRFGAFARQEMPGLRYHLPAPIEEVLLPVVTTQNEIPIGFRRSARGGGAQRVPEESQMLTQDENVINVEFTVFWRIGDIHKHMFEIRDPRDTIKMAAESVMREVIGRNKLQFALTDGRSQIAEEARSRLQALMDEYAAGVMVTQINLQTVSVPDAVKDAFQDVVNAGLDQERRQNEAQAYVNKVVPAAKGKASQMLQEALAYRDRKIAIAQGEADRFREVLAAYNGSRDVTARRLYIETMEDILANTQKVIVDKGTGAGPMPYYPLQDLIRNRSDRAGGTP